MKRPVQLQFNQAGAWRGAVTFDAPTCEWASHELTSAAETIARCAPGVRMRIVACKPAENGSWVGTHQVVMSWTAEGGWVSE